MTPTDKPMSNPTPEERAEKIADIIWELPGGVDIQQKGVNLIASEIQQAVEEERKYWQEFMRLNKFEDQSECRKAAKSEAYEEAAKVAEEYIHMETEMPVAKVIVESIRALKNTL